MKLDQTFNIGSFFNGEFPGIRLKALASKDVRNLLLGQTRGPPSPVCCLWWCQGEMLIEDIMSAGPCWAVCHPTPTALVSGKTSAQRFQWLFTGRLSRTHPTPFEPAGTVCSPPWQHISESHYLINRVLLFSVSSWFPTSSIECLQVALFWKMMSIFN